VLEEQSVFVRINLEPASKETENEFHLIQKVS
jgi:hypothetical protein